MSARPNLTLQGKIMLSLDIEDFKKIESLLIEKRIPFSISYTYEGTENQVLKSAEKIREANDEAHETFEHSTIVAEKLEQIISKYIRSNFDLEASSLEDICEELGMKESTFKRLFKQYYGMTLHQYYMVKKMDHAANLIRGGHTITSVSKIIGYAHPIKFTKMFQKHFRISPKKYQQFQKNLSLEKLRSQIIGPQKVSDMS